METLRRECVRDGVVPLPLLPSPSLAPSPSPSLALVAVSPRSFPFYQQTVVLCVLCVVVHAHSRLYLHHHHQHHQLRCPCQSLAHNPRRRHSLCIVQSLARAYVLVPVARASLSLAYMHAPSLPPFVSLPLRFEVPRVSPSTLAGFVVYDAASRSISCLLPASMNASFSDLRSAFASRPRNATILVALFLHMNCGIRRVDCYVHRSHRNNRIIHRPPTTNKCIDLYSQDFRTKNDHRYKQLYQARRRRSPHNHNSRH
mmetsp:Transcript_25059/g.40652  ORF Transcript_25059/g.40652 Transcript_25059/m.40652 type:complete len:257 (+) Transcript_25059:450-1220(+)